jgi:hypothetical protein
MLHTGGCLLAHEPRIPDGTALKNYGCHVEKVGEGYGTRDRKATPWQGGPIVFFKVIACEVTYREICYTAARATNLTDLEFLPGTHHENAVLGREHIQERIDAVPEGKFDAILIGYGLCNMMIAGLTTYHTPLVIPRAHDCITLSLGSKERYREAFTACTGTYYYTPGWLEQGKRGGEDVEDTQETCQQGAGICLQLQYEALVDKYGEDNARYLAAFFNHWGDHYERGVLIQFDFTRHLNLKEQVLELCDRNGWTFQEMEGDLSLLQRWLDGTWDEEDFLVVRPGERVIVTYDKGIIGTRD